MKLKESTKSVLRLVSMAVEIVVYSMPDTYNANEVIPVEMSLAKTNLVLNKLKATDTEKKAVLEVLSKIHIIQLDNREKVVNSTTMGGFVTIRGRKYAELFINVAGLLGNSEHKTKKEILEYRNPTKSINNFKSILGHELRHAFQHSEYSTKLPDPSDDGYDYDTSPTEIDASFIESLLDNNIEQYSDASSFVTDIMKSFNRKKPLSNKNKNHYRRKAAKFFALYHENDNNVEALVERLKNIRDKIENEFIADFHKANSINMDNITVQSEKLIKQYGINIPEEHQANDVILNRIDAISSIVRAFNNGSDGDKISLSSVHLTLTSIVFANSVSSIRHIKKVVGKILTKAGVTLEDTIQYISENGFFKNSKSTTVDVLTKILKEFN